MKEHLKRLPGETEEQRRKRIRKGTLHKVGAAFTNEMFVELEELCKKRGLSSVPELIRVVMSEAVFSAKRATQQGAPSYTQPAKATNNKQENKKK